MHVCVNNRHTERQQRERDRERETERERQRERDREREPERERQGERDVAQWNGRGHKSQEGTVESRRHMRSD